MKRNFYLSLFFSTLILIGCGLFWFKNISAPLVNPDEVVWVLDARFYKFRYQKQWEKFTLADNPRSLGWDKDEFRLVDQPQLGKYIYGLIISTFNFDPWVDEAQSLLLYNQFASLRLDRDSIKTDQKYSELMKSINVLRVFGAIAGFMSIAIFSVAVYFLTKSRVIGSLTGIFLFFNPILWYWYRTAVPNSFQALLIMIAIILMFYLLGSIKILNLKKKVLWVLVGILIAASTSIKLNGIFILFAPIFIWMIQEVRSCFSSTQIFWHVANKIKAYLLLFGGFVASFYFLEPELWGHPVEGLKILFGVRLDQHQRFLSAYENYSFFETFFFLMVQFLTISDLIVVKLLLLFLLILGVKKLYNKLSDPSWLRLSLLMLFVVISNIFYANVGFDRYAEWSIYVFSFLSAMGLVELLKIIYQKINQQ